MERRGRQVELAGEAAAASGVGTPTLNYERAPVTDGSNEIEPPGPSERELVAFGRISGVVILISSVLVGLYYSTQGESLYVQLQRVFFFIAPPFAVVFTLGLQWRRANATAAVWT